jgi:RND family efflux transporter MFP subunit
MKNILHKIKLYVVAHKIISGVVLIVVILVGYWGYTKITSTIGDTRYVSSKVTTGTIVVSVADTGQVSNVNQISLEPKTGGDVIYIGVQNGQNVSAGQIILEVDPTTAEQAVQSAQASLDNANLSLKKLEIQDSSQNISANLEKAYSDSLSTVSSTFADLNSVATGLNNILSATSLSDNAARTAGNGATDYRNKAEDDYITLTGALFQNSKDYAQINSSSTGTDIVNIIQETHNTAKNLSDAVKSASDFVNFMVTESKNTSTFTSYQNTLSTYTNTSNGDLSNLLSAETNIQSNEDSSQSTSLDIQGAELSVQQQENALGQAKENLADCYLRAPFAGTITNFTVQKAESIGTGTAVGTLITQQQYATVSLNEVDVAKVQVGQKATLTFDAIPNLSVAGVVSEIDSIGTVSSGVVNYNIRISFSSQDSRIKSGMSVNAAIITAIKQDVLLVPNGAVKSSGGVSYVQMFKPPLPPPTDGLTGSISKTPPMQVPIQVGLSNNSETEIVSGLSEGDEVVTRIINPTTTTTATTAPSILGSPAGRGGGGVRIP